MSTDRSGPDQSARDQAGPDQGGPEEVVPEEVVLALRGVSVGYAERTVVHEVDLTVRRGEVVAVLGANGSGKTTLVRGLLGLATVVAGQVELLGQPVGARGLGSRIGYVPQRHTVGGTIPSTVREVVSSGRLPRLGWLGRLRAHDRAAVQGAIEAVDLAAVADTDLADLSGGQQRRALIARALACEPELLVMDEPTAGVDQASQQALARTIAHLVQLGVTIVVVTHEVGPLAGVVTRAVVVQDGRIAYDGELAPELLGAADGVGAAGHGHGHHHHVDDPADTGGRATWLTPTVGDR